MSEQRPPKRFNIIEARLKSPNYNAKTRKTNRNYLTQYTRKRGGEEQTALVKQRAKRAMELLAAFGSLTPAPFTQVDVGGDGNCFYRALYRVAKEHKDPTMLERVFTILGADKTQLGAEETGQAALRAATARLIAEQAENPEGIYERVKGAAMMPKDEQFFFKALVDEAGYGIQPIYRRIKSYTRKKNGKRAFYANLSAAVGTNGEYASETDYYMVRDLLEANGIQVVSTAKMPTSNTVHGMPVLYLRRVNENHYNYWRAN